MTADKIITALEVLLAQLAATISSPMTEGDSRTEFLKGENDGYKSKVQRLAKVLKSHAAAERRKKFLNRQNKENK